MATIDLPITCIMPTRDRRPFVARAIEYFRRQDYHERELVIIDDGDDPVADLAAADPRIRYMRLDHRATIGAKRNLACEVASGAVILHWDDDDWMADWRISYQLTYLLRRQADICGLSSLFYYDLTTGKSWQYVYRQGGTQPWVAGNTLCYTRALWQVNPFLNLSVGEDAHFVWSQHPKRVTVLPRFDFFIGVIHGENIAPKRPDNNWHPFPEVRLQRCMGDDWNFYRSLLWRNSDTHQVPPTVHEADWLSLGKECEEPARPSAPPVQNVFACLVHENPACVLDLVRNLRYLDPRSTILLYNGSNDSRLLNDYCPFERYDVVVHPKPRPMVWGKLHNFALDCMRFALDHMRFDTLTIVDSDQLGIRSHYSEYLGHILSNQTGIGMLGNAPDRQLPNTSVPPAVQAWKEFDLWRPFLRRFPNGQEKFLYWTFWPSTVFTADAVRDLTLMFARDEQLNEIMRQSEIWATEEVILPTLVALLGYRVVAHRCSYDYVKYKVAFSIPQVEAAFARPDVFWVHPVARRYDDQLREYIRTQLRHYVKFDNQEEVMLESTTNDRRSLLLTRPLMAQMKGIEGWLEENEADLLIAAAIRALTTLPAPHALVEVGSYCGRGTTVLGYVAKAISPEKTKIYAIDLHDGRVGALDQEIIITPPTLEKFKRNIEDGGLTSLVEIIQQRSSDVSWDRPISLLVIDGLHDYANVAQDFFHFEKWLVTEGYIAFHDYAPYFPGVQAFVNEILSSGKYRKIHCEGSMILVQKLAVAESFDN